MPHASCLLVRLAACSCSSIQISSSSLLWNLWPNLQFTGKEKQYKINAKRCIHSQYHVLVLSLDIFHKTAMVPLYPRLLCRCLVLATPVATEDVQVEGVIKVILCQFVLVYIWCKTAKCSCERILLMAALER